MRCGTIVRGAACRNPVHWQCSFKDTGNVYHFCTRHMRSETKRGLWPHGSFDRLKAANVPINRAPVAVVASKRAYKRRLAKLADAAVERWADPMDKNGPHALYESGYRQAIRDAGVDVFHIRVRIGGVR